MSKKVMLAMSGGVDSSCALLLLQKQGYEVIGATMRLFDTDSEVCGSFRDREDARTVAARFNIPHYVFDFRDKFKKEVIDRFNDQYLRGLTPNPCVDCNRFLKFSALLEEADRLGCDYIATGHYARVGYDPESGRYLLKTAACEGGLNPKDQSYVLYNLTQAQLARVLFPLGDIAKEEVRKLAEKNGLVNHDKPDSQDICFVPDGKYADFIENYTGIKPHEGKVIDKNGNVLGSHGGMISYTIGQRKGLGIAFGKPMYVIGKNAEENTVTVGEKDELFSEGLIAEELNWIAAEKVTEEISCFAKTRYKQKETPCRVIPLEKDTVRVIFDTPQRAVTCGQRIVFYNGENVIGGGVIKKPIKM